MVSFNIKATKITGHLAASCHEDVTGKVNVPSAPKPSLGRCTEDMETDAVSSLSLRK
jgi:hypothetical protein